MQRKHNAKLTEDARFLRKTMSAQERHLWYDFLRSYEHRFLRKKVIDDYIVDFYCHDARLIIEIEYDQIDTITLDDKMKMIDHMRNRKLVVLWLSAQYINTHFADVCEYIDYTAKLLISNPPRRLRRHPPLGKGGRNHTK